MGFLDWLGLGRARLDRLASPSSVGVSSPWTGASTLSSVVIGEVFGADMAKLLPLGRMDALAIPAVSKARNLLVATIAQYPLVAYDAAGSNLPTQPTFLYRTDGPVTPYHRLAATVDDLIFYGTSLWVLQRGARQEGSRFGPILDAAWVPHDTWKIEKGRIVVNERNLEDDQYLLFEVPLFPGLLAVGARTLRGARDTELAWTARMKAPPYLTEVRITDDTNLDQAEATAWLDAWVEKHQPGNPSVGLSPMGMELFTHPGSIGEADLFLGNRDAIRTDVGSFLNIRAAMLDGTTGVDSLTYTTKEGEKNSFFEIDLPMWTQPIEQAITAALPGGQRCRLEISETEGTITAPVAPEEAAA